MPAGLFRSLVVPELAFIACYGVNLVEQDSEGEWR